MRGGEARGRDILNAFVMYIEDKDKFMDEWKRLADNWYRLDKVVGDGFAMIFVVYSGPRSVGFYDGLLKHLYDDFLTPEAYGFFYDNLENQHMKSLYPFSLAMMSGGLL